jgi:hypothetical protein
MYKTALEVKGLKVLYEDDIEVGETYCFPIPRWLSNSDEQVYDTAVATKRIKKRGVSFMPYAIDMVKKNESRREDKRLLMKTIVRILVTPLLALVWIAVIPMTLIFDFCFALGDWLKTQEERTFFTLFKNQIAEDVRTFPSPVKLWRE